MFVGRETMLRMPWAPGYVSKIKEVIRAVGAYPALQAAGARRKLRTNNNAKYCAFLRTSKNKDQQVLVVLNFQQDSRLIRVELGEPAKLTEIFTQKRLGTTTRLELALPPYGYRLYLVDGGGQGFSGSDEAGGYEIAGSIGQPDAGFLAGDGYDLVGGLWAGVDARHIVSLPPALRGL
jgi:hypothetical protein